VCVYIYIYVLKRRRRRRKRNLHVQGTNIPITMVLNEVGKCVSTRHPSSITVKTVIGIAKGSFRISVF
jgi:hypothetical protein